MSWRRAKTPGWAAFDPKKQQNQVANNDPYPPIATTLHQCQNPSPNGKSFSSVLTRSTSVPNIIANHTSLNVANNLIAVPDVNGNNVSVKLKEIYPWANETLIEDIMAAVDNDFDKASSLLQEMASPARLQENKEQEFEHNIEGPFGNSVPENTGIHVDGRAFSGKVIEEEDVRIGLLLESLSMIPMEPEWEDDDMYIMHRRDAIKAMRLASRYSKAASEAYLRRDHAAAHEYSLKAREEWSLSEKLNAKAAREILAIRNSENDDWKLDLHGLHATEAVQVLQEHLLKIESQVSGTHSVKNDKYNLKVRSTHAVSIESFSSETEKSDKQQQLSRPRLLEVITGKGSHSRGEAALPVAVKSFLSEKGYYSYEARIGVITVQPKFRQLSTALVNT